MPDWSRDDLTYGDILHPAMRVQTEAEADQFLLTYVAYLCRRWGGYPEQRMTDAKCNIGYWTGYFDRETAERVMRLFNCAHPIFGKTTPTPEEALAAGKRLAQRHP